MPPPALSLRNLEGDIIIMPPSRRRRSLSLLPPAHVVVVVAVLVPAALTFDRLMTAENRVVLLGAAHAVAVAVARSRPPPPPPNAHPLDFLFPANAT